MRPSRPAITAAIILTIEAIALAVISIIELVALGAGGAASTGGAIALIVLTLIAAAALGAFAWGTLRRVSWARSGGTLFQVLGIAVALSSLALQPIPWVFTLSVGGLCVLGLIALLAAVRHDGAADPRLRERQQPPRYDD